MTSGASSDCVITRFKVTELLQDIMDRKLEMITALDLCEIVCSDVGSAKTVEVTFDGLGGVLAEPTHIRNGLAHQGKR